MELIVNSTTIRIIISAITLFIGVIIVRKIIRSFFSRTSFFEERKEKTLEAMINSIISYVALIGFIIVVLSEFGIDIGRILAGAGIIGIIIGFGAQSLIKDFFAGLFLLYEEQLHKGDYITLNNTHHGTVEDIGLRFIKIREWSGKLLTISNGQIHTIENYNFEYMRVIENVTTNFREDPRTVFNVLEEACERLNEELAIYLKRDLTRKTIEPFQVYGMSSLNENYHGYQYTVTGVVEDLVYWTASKETRRIIAETMYDHNIAMAEQRVQVQSYSSKEE
ncbi:mechanosensitive ion channel family protein [Halobacillus shinanisalinarum]|uniref:Mechanosensitive ion channel family protein n=1 Tax=Halobacillus shinanisalinarum TaxID=2932258 RepID=A0ABY4H5X8_9BACI|nr:mechanosensitive ion channel family protein [Halobacillus shinanisalinarum]UOQ95754.1 mechanosensitive ion channel family protein [Halobacillus shinanisalinarum]